MTVSRSLAINVAANTTLPGFRAPIYPDGSFVYVPIPEREPADEEVPTYADLNLDLSIPEDLLDRQVHLDPAFRGYHDCPEYTYGDEHSVKAGPIKALAAGDRLYFYATLEPAADPTDLPDWIAPDWGAYLIGVFVLGMDPVSGEAYHDLPAADREPFATNAHVRRETFDAEVLAYGDPERSRLFDRAIPLSSRRAGADANRIVTDLSADSGKGPWWRRPLRFDDRASDDLARIVAERDLDACFDRP